MAGAGVTILDHKVPLAVEVTQGKIKVYHGSPYKSCLFLPNLHMRKKPASIPMKSLLFQGFLTLQLIPVLMNYHLQMESGAQMPAGAR